MKRRPLITRALLGVAPVCLIFLTARYLHRDRNRRHLIEAPGRAQYIGLHGGTLYWTARSGMGTIAIIGAPIEGGAPQTVATERDQQPAAVSVDAAVVQGDRLIYRLGYPHNTLSLMTLQPVGAARSAGVYLISPASVQPHAGGWLYRTRPPAPPSPPQARAGHLYSVALTGGQVSSVPILDSSGAPVDVGHATLIGDRVYWRVRRAPIYTFASDTCRWDEVTPADDLMSAPVSGGRATRVATGLCPFGPILGDAETVCWLQPRRYPDRRQDLFRLTLATGRIQRIEDYDGLISPISLHDRLYWIGGYRWNTLGRTLHGDLMSSRPDGSDRRRVAPLRALGYSPVRSDALFLAGGNLYLVYSANVAAPTTETPNGIARRFFVAAVRPDRASGLGDGQMLPPTAEVPPFFVEDGWLYYDESGAAPGTEGQGDESTQKRYLCRVRLS